MRQVDGEWGMVQPLSNDWKPKIRPILELYADRVPGTFVEEKDYSLVWHYRRADAEMGPLRAKELLSHLVDFTVKMDVQILQGSKVIEVKCGLMRRRVHHLDAEVLLGTR